MKKNRAFTLIEMSVVLIIIGLLAAGTMGGISLIKSSRLATARALTSRSPIAGIDGLVAWYETSSVDSLKAAENYNNAPITSWYDISPSSIILRKNTLIKNGTASNNLTYLSNGINGLPGVKFNGGYLTIANFYQGNLRQRTQFVVIKPTKTDSAILSGLTISQNKVKFPDGSTTSSINPAIAGDQNYIISVYYSDANSKAYINNALNMVGGSAVNTTTNMQNGLSAGFDAGNLYLGLISEIIIYNRPLKTDERKDVFKYLSEKYKIQVQGI